MNSVKKYYKDDAFVHMENAWIEGGSRLALKMEMMMRSFDDNAGWQDINKPLCPACYMLIAYNMLVMLAERNGQDLQELRSSMAKLFSDMDVSDPYTTEMQIVCEVPNNECEEETG